MMRDDMDFLKFVAAVVILSASGGVQSEDGGYDHERLTTLEGRTYQAVFVIGSDATGLTFRHREGIAKIPFSSLSESYRMLYETVEELPAADSGGPQAKDAPEAALEEDEAFALEPATLVARNRVLLPLAPAPLRLGGGIVHPARPLAWPSWWPDHGPIHRLAHPLYREWAVRDFLHSSGLLPLPCRFASIPLTP